MKKRISIGLVLVAAAVLPAACGNGGDTGSSSGMGGAESSSSGTPSSSSSSASASSSTSSNSSSSTSSSGMGGGMASDLGKPCKTKADCMLAQCLDENTWGFPFGACSGDCDPNVPKCDNNNGYCIPDNLAMGHCIKACTMGGNQCGNGYACTDFFMDGSALVCLPACTMNNQCPTLGYCDVGSGYCTLPEDCSNALDDDNDGAIDCDDTDCTMTCAAQIMMACMSPPAAMASNMGDTMAGTQLFSGSCTGAGAHEQVYSLTPGMVGETGQLDLVLSSMTDQGVYVRTDCADSMSEIACIDVVVGGTDEKLRLTVTGGTPLTIFVDGYQPGEEGAFTLNAAFTPAVCNDGNVTLPEQCDDMNNMPGDGCDATCQVETAAFCMSVPAAIIGANMGDTATGTNAFQGSCTGANARERVFSVTPAMSGMLHIVLASADDQGIYVRTDCADDMTELDCKDAVPGGQDEMLDVAVTAGVPVTIFVDGFKPAQEGPFTLTLTLM